MRGIKKFITLGLIFSMIFSLVSCGSDKSEGENEDVSGEELNICIASEPQTIDPALNSSIYEAMYILHTFEGLTKWEDDGSGNAKLAPGVAESWDISPDECEYTFHLRANSTWSDGEQVKAEDFVYAWNRVADPITASDYSYMLDPIKGFEAGTDQLTPDITAVDDRTLVVKLDVPCDSFLEICAYPTLMPVRKDALEKGKDKWTLNPETYISNGPFKLVEWKHNGYIRLEKREDYYDANNIAPSAIVWHLMDEAEKKLSYINSGQLDFTNDVPPEDITKLIESGKLVIDPQLGTYFVCFNMNKKPFDDSRVREAFSLVIDRNYICDQIVADGSKPAAALVSPGLWDATGVGSDFRKKGGDFYDVSKEGYEANVKRAKELLAQAGYPNGEGFPVVEYLYNTGDMSKAIAESLMSMWEKQLGVDVELINKDWAVFLQERKNGNFSIAKNVWVADYNDPMTFLDMWISENGNNDAGYKNPAYDELISKAKNSKSKEEEMSYLHDAEQLLVKEDNVLAPIYFNSGKRVASEDLKGYFYSPLGHYFFYKATKEK